MVKAMKDTGTPENFMFQVERAAKITEIKYPMTEGWRLVWVFKDYRDKVSYDCRGGG